MTTKKRTITSDMTMTDIAIHDCSQLFPSRTQTVGSACSPRTRLLRNIARHHPDDPKLFAALDATNRYLDELLLGPGQEALQGARLRMAGSSSAPQGNLA